MSDIYLSNNGGQRVSPHPNLSHPVNGTGQQLTNGSADTDTTATVVAGAQYAVTALNTGGFILGLSDPTTATNVMWVCPLYETIVIKIPEGSTTLHYATDTADGIAYLRKLSS